MSHTQVFAMGNIYNIKSSKTQPHVVMTLTLSTITAPSVLGKGCLIMSLENILSEACGSCAILICSLCFLKIDNKQRFYLSFTRYLQNNTTITCIIINDSIVYKRKLG